jgi:hypothetical protein
MKLGQLRRPEAELAPGDAVALDQPASLQMIEIPARRVGEFEIADAVLQVEPGVIDVQG